MAKTKTNGQTSNRTFRMKAGVDVPQKFDGAEITIRLAGDTQDAEQALANMLALTSGNVQAVLDTFNSAAALDVQKTIKAAATEEVSVADLQMLADQHEIKENTRGRGGNGGKKAAVKAKAEKFEQVEAAASSVLDELEALRETDPAAYEAQRALMIRLGLIQE